MTTLAVIGWTEGALIVGAIVLLFGARKLPELGRSIGEGIKEFRKASRGLMEDEEKKAEGQEPGLEAQEKS